jgi:uncharacterized paraquat-inducible protein A
MTALAIVSLLPFWVLAFVMYTAWKRSRIERPNDSGGRATHCPNCNYDLSGLAAARCPECGTTGDDEHRESRRRAGSIVLRKTENAIILMILGIVALLSLILPLGLITRD